ncbi:TPR_REGION domain-containing protein [Tenacibaculum sp. 190524A02b]|uniref:tetratricopeptide repeat protein n=1 Tax=Tenacibaculum vairaonense TaxID=3137860 RepID=UPI0032B1A1F0
MIKYIIVVIVNLLTFQKQDLSSLTNTTLNQKNNFKSTLHYYNLGNSYAKNYFHAKAIESYNKALLTSQEDTLTIKTKNAIGILYLSLKNFPLAKKYATEALNTSSQISYTKGKAKAYSLLGNIKEKKGEYLEAIKFQKLSLNKFTQLKNKLGIAQTNINIGSIYEDLTQYNKAYQYFLGAYHLFKNTNTFEESDVLNNIGDVYRKKGNVKESISFTQKSLIIAEKLKNTNLLESAYKDLSKAYFILGQYKKAYEYRVKSENYKEITLKNQNTKQLNFLEANYSSEKKEAEIQLLKEKNKTNLSNQKLLIVALIGIISYISIAGYFFSKKRKEKQKLQIYKERTLQAELEKKLAQESVMKKDIETKTATLSKYSLHLSQKNKILYHISKNLKNLSEREPSNYQKKIKEIAKEIDFTIKQDNEWEGFDNLFQDIHPDFNKKLLEISTEKLSPTELKLSMLLRLNLSSKEIASILRVTPDSVRVARYRLRKKLPIEPKQELVNFMLTI